MKNGIMLLEKDKSLANEKKVKLIFDKLKKSGSNYIHEIHEFVIESLTEERTETELLCHVECVGAAFKSWARLVQNYFSILKLLSWR